LTPHADGYFVRTSDQYEVDLVIAGGKSPVLIEVKAGLSVDSRDVARLRKSVSLLDAGRAYFVTYGSDRYPSAPGIETIGIEHWMRTGFEPFWAE
jgi:predicted AAA+ superfamily ATPase